MIKEMPKTVVRTLLDDQEFVAFAELSVLDYGDIGSFRHQDIVSALEKARNADGKADLVAGNGRRFVLGRLSDGKGATMSEDGAESRLISEFGLLDPERENRLAALAATEGKCWPSLPSAAMWRSVLMERPLGEMELAHLISDVRDTPSQFLAALEGKWKSGAQMGAEEFFPTSLAYYAALAGLPHDTKAMDDWMADTLMPDLRQGIERSVADGLRQVLALNVDSRLSPDKFIGDISDQELLLALGDLVQTVSPFALLGIMEIALARVAGNGDFGVLASDALDRLFGEKSKTNGIEASWRMLPALIKAGVGRFVAGWELWGRPPYWRRLAAHAHANILVELLDAQGTDVDRFVDWLGGQVLEGEAAAHILGLREEPLWRAWDMSPRQIRASVVGRLMSMRRALDDMGLSATLDSAVGAMKEEYGQLDANRPGPLVGTGTRMSDNLGQGGTDDESVSEFFLQAATDLELDPSGEAWKGLSVACRLLQFEGGLLDRLARVVARVAPADGEEGMKVFFETLLLAADIAATQPDETIARKVAEALVGAAGRFSGEGDVVTGLRVLVIASGATRERERGMKWLAERILEYAFTIPRGLPCRRLLFELDTMQTLIPIRDRCFGRARKIAAAGMN